MTVCIAGKCQTGIIAMCDRMISTGHYSADDMALKFRDIHREWHAMFAGNDVSRIKPLIDKAKKRLTGAKGSLAEVEDAMRASFHEELIQKQTDLVLSRYGLTMKEFLDTGLRRFGETQFTAIKYQLDQINLECAFLVYGLDDNNTEHIFTVEDPGIACNHDLYGFWSIGSGSNRALSSLFFHDFRQALPEWKAVYLIAEAKFMAEGGEVGEETLVMIQRNDGTNQGSLDIDGIKGLWNKSGRPKIPRNAEAVIMKSIEKEFFTVRFPTPSTSEKSKSGQ